MDLSQLRSFIAVAELGSFSGAARSLGVAQPSVSEQIRKLERRLGGPVFDRLPRGVVLTEAGRMLLAKGRQLLADADALDRGIVEATGKVAGTLHVGAIPTIAPFILPAVLAAFRAAHPNVKLIVTEDITTRLLMGVEEGAIDLVLVSDVTLTSTITLEHLADEPLVVVMPVDHPLARRARVKPAELGRQEMLVLTEMHCLSRQVTELCPLRRAGATVTMRGEQLSTLVSLVGTGLGISVVPAMMIDASGRGHLLFKPLSGRLASRPINVATSVLRHRSNALRALLDVLRPACQNRCNDLKSWR